MWPGFSALPFAWFFLLLVPLVIFYFLKLRRPRVELPSLALWRQVINDSRVNSPFQKFKRNLLLLLQILLLTALVFAGMQPFWPAGADNARYVPVLIDISASMGALDAPGGKTRLDAAKDEVRTLIDNLLPEQRLCLISVDDTARRLTDFTENKRLLHQAVDGLAVTQRTSEWSDGLRMAEALGRTVPLSNVLLLSDGNFPAKIDFELPYKISFQKVPAGGANVGITELNARRGPTGWTIFLRLEASEQPGGLIEVEVLENGEVVQRESVTVAAKSSQRMTFNVSSQEATSVEVRLRPDGFDALAADNQAFLELPTLRPLNVYCPGGMASFRHALAALSNLRVHPTEGLTDSGTYDLLITDQATDLSKEAGTILGVGLIPEDLQSLIEFKKEPADVTDWQRTAPLLQHVQLLDVQIAETAAYLAGMTDREVEQTGYSILAHGRQGPLIVSNEVGSQGRYYLLFHTDRSTLPFRVGFPILLANAVQIAQQNAGLSEVKSLPTGVLPPMRLKPETEYRVEGGGETLTLKTDTAGILAGVAAPVSGAYRITQGDDLVRPLGVSLGSPLETSLASTDKLAFAEGAVEASRQTLKTDYPLWRWLAWAGLVLLVVEWWYFQKSPMPVAKTA